MRSPRNPRNLLATILLTTVASLIAATATSLTVNAATPGGSWSITGSNITPRENSMAVLLPSGKVLAAGGQTFGSCTNLATAELYDPSTAGWTVTGTMYYGPRANATSVRLPSGKVLIAGGAYGSCYGQSTNSAELYDPAAGTFSPTGNLNDARVGAQGILLANGKVLIAGGTNQYSCCLGSAELYDPATGSFTWTGSLSAPRFGPMALLQSGKVLFAGTCPAGGSADPRSAEIYDPASGVWSRTGGMNVGRCATGLTLLANGKVLIAGGMDPSGTVLASAELFDPSSGTWSFTGSLSTPRYGFGPQQNADLVTLPNGEVLATGGQDGGGNILGSTELYNPASGTWTLTGTMNGAREFQRTVGLSNGTVLTFGGYNATAPAYTSSAEVFTPTQYGFSGFYAPVVNPPAVNTGKAGRTYPVKWSLTDQSGAPVSSLSAVIGISMTPNACSTFGTDPTDAMTTTSTGSAGLRYDSAAGQYVYNWATPGAGCYTLTVTLDSGQAFSAYFELS